MLYKKIPLSVFLIIMLSPLSCSKLEGSFSIKRMGEDSYKKIFNDIELNQDIPVDWIFSFNNVSGYSKILVILMKKEIVWVDVRNDSDYIDSTKKNIYGKISGLETGDYRISIISIEEKNVLIGNLPFTVYRD